MHHLHLLQAKQSGKRQRLIIQLGVMGESCLLVAVLGGHTCVTCPCSAKVHPHQPQRTAQPIHKLDMLGLVLSAFRYQTRVAATRTTSQAAARVLGEAALHSKAQEQRKEDTCSSRLSKDSDAPAAAPEQPRQLLSIWPSVLTSRTARQRPFSTQASASKMATAQTIQQRTSLDLALANPVYQGERGVRGVWRSSLVQLWALGQCCGMGCNRRVVMAQCLKCL